MPAADMTRARFRLHARRRRCDTTDAVYEMSFTYTRQSATRSLPCLILIFDYQALATQAADVASEYRASRRHRNRSPFDERAPAASKRYIDAAYARNMIERKLHLCLRVI